MNALRIRLSSLLPSALSLGLLDNSLRIFARVESGATAIFFALTAPVWIGGLALGIEVGHWYYAEQRLQSTADILATSLAARAATDAPETELSFLANHILSRNQFQGSATWTQAAAPDKTLTVELTRPIVRYLSKIFEPDDLTIRVTSSAEPRMATQGCVLAVGRNFPARDVTIENGAAPQVNGCEVLSNSILRLRAGSILTTDCARTNAAFISQGTVSLKCEGGPRQGNPIVSDPYADWEDINPNLVSQCNVPASVIVRNANDFDQIQKHTVNGRQYARFCGGGWGHHLTLDAPNSPLTIPEGLTFIFDEQSSFLITDGTNVTGRDVSFLFLKGSIPIINAPNSKIDLVSTEAASRMLFRGARTIGFLPGASTINVGPGSRIDGTVYFPATGITFSARGDLSCLQIIGGSVNLTGNWRSLGPCAGLGSDPIIASWVGQLTQ